MDKIISKLKSGNYKKISFVLGAGASVPSGIPDFRSKGGLYDMVKNKHNLTDPNLLFDINYFKKNPQVYYDYLKNRIDLDVINPSKTHLFIKKVEVKQMLFKVFTQNIDCLEEKAGVSSEKTIQCHGNYKQIICSLCKKEKKLEIFLSKVDKGQVLYCECGGACKSSVVFFGESLPEIFYKEKESIILSDLVIIIGTSLKVSPFNTLIKIAKNSNNNIDFLLINKEDSLKRFFKTEEYSFLQGDSDQQIEYLEKQIDF